MDEKELKQFYVYGPGLWLWLFLMLRLFVFSICKKPTKTVLSFVNENLLICIPYKSKNYAMLGTQLSIDYVNAIRIKLDQIESFNLKAKNE